MAMSLALKPMGMIPDPSEWQTLLQMADVLVKSGLAPDSIKTPQAAIIVMMKGRELGIPPLHAINSIVVIKGKPTASAELLLAIIYRDHGDDAIRFTETTPQKATISYKRRAWTQRQAFTFSIQDATTAGLTVSDTWRKYPGALLRARCISAVARLAFPDSIGGMYTPEELGATVRVTDDGQIETEVETIPDARTANVDQETGEIVGRHVPQTQPILPTNGAALTPEQRKKAIARFGQLWDKAQARGIPNLQAIDQRTISDADLIARGKDLAETVQRAESEFEADLFDASPQPELVGATR